MAAPGRGRKKLEEESSKNGVVGSNVADSDSDSVGRRMRARVVAPINPQRGCENIPRYTELSHMAIDYFSSQNNKRYEFVTNLSVTTSLAAGFWCRITFQARDADASGAVKTFQTLAWWGIDGDKEIMFLQA